MSFFPEEIVWDRVYSYNRLTEETNPFFVLGENTLEQNRRYRIQYTVINAEKGRREKNFDIKTNKIPHSGNCIADQTEVEAATGILNVKCQGWQDDESPFVSYEAWTKPLNSSDQKLLYFGNTSTFQLRLPLGDENNGYPLGVEVKVLDDLRESVNLVFNLTVRRFR